MAEIELFREYVAGDTLLRFYRESDVFAMTLLPRALAEQVPDRHRRLLDDTPDCRGLAQALGCHFPAAPLEHMVQVKIATDAYAARFSSGCSLRNGETVDALRFQSQTVPRPGEIVTCFRGGHGMEYRQTVRYPEDGAWFEISTEAINRGDTPVKLEMLAGFSLGMLSIFQPENDVESIRIHRWRSSWSGEARHECRSAESLNLEMSWQGYALRNCRFGAQGSMPCKDFFPAAALEDTARGVVWGAQLDAIGAWQLEISRFGDWFNLSGGLPDREFGQWTRTLAPGDTFHSPAAAIGCIQGSVSRLMERIVSRQRTVLPPRPATESDLPVIFNEWCSTWGRPTEANLRPYAEKLKNRGIRYFVLDCGWFNATGDGLSNVGDWDLPERENYPGGLANFIEWLRRAGFIPGIWFEFENCTEGSRIEREHPDWLLHLDGAVIKQGPRRFLDFRRPEVREYLEHKVIDFLKKYGFGYIKVDYNAPTGFGCDGPDSPPEELRKHLDQVALFYRRLRREIPDLIIEICASGGHRLSPAWTQLGAMESFSDAHESISIPLIAADTAQLIPPGHNQIWAVLRHDDPMRRTVWSLAAGFLGRLCLSGDLDRLSPEADRMVDRAIRLYQLAAPIIDDGETTLIRSLNESRNHPRGYQWSLRRDRAGCILAVLHVFADGPTELELPVRGELLTSLAESTVKIICKNSKITISDLKDWSSVVLLIQGANSKNICG